MGKKKENLLDYINKDNKPVTKQLVPAIIIIAAAICLIVVMVWFLSGGNKGSSPDQVQTSDLSDSKKISEAEDIISEQGNEETVPTAEAIIEPANADSSTDADQEKDVIDELTPDETSTPDETGVEVPPVEVAPVEDKEDPQIKGSNGVKLEVSDIDSSKEKTETTTYGIDVAKWQGVIDWAKVKKAGVEFAMIRVGYRTQVTGEIYEDPYAKYNLQQAKANGIKIGVYFFSTAINKQEAREEAAWVTEYIAPYPITYPVAYNCEGFTNQDNRQYNMSKEDRTVIAVAFLDYVKKQGYTPMFYASKNELQNNAQWDTDRLNSRYKIWVAQYPNEPYTASSQSTYTGEHAMWQYTSQGKVPGINGKVDINIAYFGYEKEAKAEDDSPQEEVEADPTALIEFKEVKETVTAKIETNLRILPSTVDQETIYAVLKNGDTAVRTGIGNNGWSRVEYEGQILYAVSSYLTTDLINQGKSTPSPDNPEAGTKFTEVNEQVTAKEITNLRLVPSSEQEETIVIALKNGEIAVRTGIGDNGWSRLEYNGQTLYAVSSLLMVVEQKD